MRRIAIAVSVCALALMGLAGPASARTVDRPFKATLVGATSNIVFADGFDLANPDPSATSTFDGRCPGGANWVIYFTGRGHGTHLGKFTWSSSHCTLLTSLNPPNVTISDGLFDYVAANGDVLHEDYVSVGGLVLVGDQLCANTAATFNGGTGRFANASGTALEVGCWSAAIQGPVLPRIDITSSGTVAYDASDRR